MNAAKLGGYLKTLYGKNPLAVALYADPKQHTKLVDVAEARLVNNGTNSSKLILPNRNDILVAFEGITLYDEDRNLVFYIRHSERRNVSIKDGEFTLRIINSLKGTKMSLTIK